MSLLLLYSYLTCVTLVDSCKSMTNTVIVKKDDIAGDETIESSDSSGFHLLELHKPTLLSGSIAILVILAVILAVYCCLRRMHGRRNRRRFVQTRMSPSHELRQFVPAIQRHATPPMVEQQVNYPATDTPQTFKYPPGF